MINLDKLNSQLDINNLDYAQVLKIVTEHQKILNVIFIVGTLFMAVGVFNSHRSKDASIIAQMSQEQSKIDIIKSRDKAIGDFNAYASSLPKEITIFDVITQVTGYAKSTNSTIISYTPDPGQNTRLYDLISVHFVVESGNFKDMMVFLRKVDNSSFPIRIDSWAGSEGDDGKITSNVEISAVHIHL